MSLNCLREHSAKHLFCKFRGSENERSKFDQMTVFDDNIIGKLQILLAFLLRTNSCHFGRIRWLY